MSSTFDATARKSGNSLVVTIPYNVVKAHKIKDGTGLRVTVLKVNNQEEVPELICLTSLWWSTA